MNIIRRIRRIKIFQGAVILPTLLFLAGLTLAISLSFSFFSTSGTQAVSRSLKSAYALAGAESGIDDAIVRILKIFAGLPREREFAFTSLHTGLNLLASYNFSIVRADDVMIPITVSVCYVIDGIDTCDGDIEQGKLRIRSSAQFGNIYRVLQAIVSVDALTWRITVDSVEEIAYGDVFGDGEYDIAYWKFDENSGTYVEDASLNTNDGAIIGGEGLSWSWTGNCVDEDISALNFFGNSGYIDIEEDSDFNFGSHPFTVSAWVYFHDLGGDMMIISKGVPSAGDGWSLAKQNDNRIWFCVNTVGGNSNTCHGDTSASLTTVTTGQWYHVAGVRNADGTMRVYLNGVGGNIYSNQPGAIISSAIPLTIGAWPTVNYGYLNGVIDEVRIFDYAFSEEDIQYLLEFEPILFC